MLVVPQQRGSMYTSPAHMRMPAQARCNLRPGCGTKALSVSVISDLHQLVAPRYAVSSHAASHKQRRLRPPAATDGTHEDVTDTEALADIDEMDTMVSEPQQSAVEVDAASSVAPTTTAQPIAAQQRTSTVQATKQRMVTPAVSPDFVAKAKVVGLGVVGVAAAVGVGFMLRKLASAQMPKMQKVLCMLLVTHVAAPYASGVTP